MQDQIKKDGRIYLFEKKALIEDINKIKEPIIYTPYNNEKNNILLVHQMIQQKVPGIYYDKKAQNLIEEVNSQKAGPNNNTWE
jgi:hypothetical protein